MLGAGKRRSGSSETRRVRAARGSVSAPATHPGRDQLAGLATTGRTRLRRRAHPDPVRPQRFPDNLGQRRPRGHRQCRIRARARRQVSAQSSSATCLSPISRRVASSAIRPRLTIGSELRFGMKLGCGVDAYGARPKALADRATCVPAQQAPRRYRRPDGAAISASTGKLLLKASRGDGHCRPHAAAFSVPQS